MIRKIILSILLIYPLFLSQCSKPSYDASDPIAWWKDARFGMFIHWGIYSIPAGEWNGVTNYGEWIRNNAQIPLEEYDKFVGQFNPVDFDAKRWVKTAKDAGMKYIVITSKHHDGFCMWDSQYTDFDIMSTPFQRDILKELSEECRRQDIKLCFYHSIMDWHHPDYLPRRIWETERSSEGADYDRYVDYMKNQIKELLTNYGEIGVLWFDGEWEGTWNHERGVDLYNYVKNIQPNIIVNNRVDKGRGGMAGMTEEGYVGDFGTPEQEIPDRGFPGVNWESCMTMNDNWGYNKNDNNWKSSTDLIRKLADIASKGGNLLLNVGPKSDGTFPEESQKILKEMGEWMDDNGESIYGTKASPFEGLTWGRVTQKMKGENSRLYLHVFDWPEDGLLRLGGVSNTPDEAYLLDDGDDLKVFREDDAVVIELPSQSPDTVNTVIVLDLYGALHVIEAPVISTTDRIFLDKLSVSITPDSLYEIRYTLDGTIPQADDKQYTSPIVLENTTSLKARKFEGDKAASDITSVNFSKVIPYPDLAVRMKSPGLFMDYYTGEWDQLPDFSKIDKLGDTIVYNCNVKGKQQEENYALVFNGYIEIPETDVYHFFTESDDGSQLYLDTNLVVDNDGLHGMEEQSGAIALKKGFHLIKVEFFERSGGDDLIVKWKSSAFDKQVIPDEVFFK